MLIAFFLFAALKSVVVFVEQTPFGDVRRVATVLVDVDFFAAFRRRRFQLTKSVSGSKARYSFFKSVHIISKRCATLKALDDLL